MNVTIYSEQPAQATPTITASAVPAEVPATEPPAPTSAPVVTDTPAPAQVQLTVKEGNDYVNVRSGPGTTFDQVGQLPKGQSSPVTGKNADATWWQIKFSDQPGWVFGELVTLSGDPSTVAVVEAPAVQATDAPAAAQPTPALAVEQPTDAPVSEQPAAESTQANCDPSYPDVCIAPPPPDLNCEDIPAKGFRVLQPDPHRLDGDKNGIGCEK
ncbi:MAG: SH3 domain-containing protein [Chloroflexi bacterium]|nr:SH3 domain-containing protein [Chloroflexota bacterium]